MTNNVSLVAIDDDVIVNFKRVAHEHGLSITDAIHVFIKQVAATESLILDGKLVDEQKREREMTEYYRNRNLKDSDIDEEGFSKTITDFAEIAANMTDEEFKKSVAEHCKR